MTSQERSICRKAHARPYRQPVGLAAYARPFGESKINFPNCGELPGSQYPEPGFGARNPGCDPLAAAVSAVASARHFWWTLNRIR